MGSRFPRDVAIDAAGDLYFAELDTSSIRQGRGCASDYGFLQPTPVSIKDPDTPATVDRRPLQRSLLPASIALDRAGDFYIPDFHNNVFASNRSDRNHHYHQRQWHQGLLQGITGQPLQQISRAQLDVAVDASGNLYIADTYNFVIRKVDTHGIITTVAGTAGVAGNHNNNGPAFGMAFNYPNGLMSMRPEECRFVADDGTTKTSSSSNHKTRRSAHAIMAGSGVGGYSAATAVQQRAQNGQAASRSRMAYRSMPPETCSSRTTTTELYAR